MQNNEYFNDNADFNSYNCQIVNSSQQLSQFKPTEADKETKLEKSRYYQKKLKEKKCNEAKNLSNAIESMESKNGAAKQKIIKLKEVIKEFKHYAEQHDLNKSQMVSSQKRIFNDNDVIIDEIIHSQNWTNAFPNYFLD
jgi:hypothetical protein